MFAPTRLAPTLTRIGMMLGEIWLSGNRHNGAAACSAPEMVVTFGCQQHTLSMQDNGSMKKIRTRHTPKNGQFTDASQKSYST
jgi:hypothetical protein